MYPSNLGQYYGAPMQGPGGVPGMSLDPRMYAQQGIPQHPMVYGPNMAGPANIPNVPPPPYTPQHAEAFQQHQRNEEMRRAKILEEEQKRRQLEATRMRLRQVGRPNTGIRGGPTVDSLIRNIVGPTPARPATSTKLTHPAPASTATEPIQDSFADFQSAVPTCTPSSINSAPPQPYPSIPSIPAASTAPKPDLNSFMMACSDLSVSSKAKTFNKNPPTLAQGGASGAHLHNQSLNHATTESKKATQWSSVSSKFDGVFAEISQQAEAIHQPHSGVLLQQQPQSNAQQFDQQQMYESRQAQMQQPQVQQQVMQNGTQDVTSPGAGIPNWATQHDRLPLVYQQLYQAAVREEGRLDTGFLYKIFLTSGLTTDILGYIWSSVNRTKPGELIREELNLALALIAIMQRRLSANPSNPEFVSLAILDSISIQEVPEPIFMIKSQTNGGTQPQSADVTNTDAENLESTATDVGQQPSPPVKPQEPLQQPMQHASQELTQQLPYPLHQNLSQQQPQQPQHQLPQNLSQQPQHQLPQNLSQHQLPQNLQQQPLQTQLQMQQFSQLSLEPQQQQKQKSLQSPTLLSMTLKDQPLNNQPNENLNEDFGGFQEANQKQLTMNGSTDNMILTMPIINNTNTKTDNLMSSDDKYSALRFLSDKDDASKDTAETPASDVKPVEDTGDWAAFSEAKPSDNWNSFPAPAASQTTSETNSWNAFPGLTSNELSTKSSDNWGTAQSQKDSTIIRSSTWDAFPTSTNAPQESKPCGTTETWGAFSRHGTSPEPSVVIPVRTKEGKPDEWANFTSAFSSQLEVIDVPPKPTALAPVPTTARSRMSSKPSPELPKVDVKISEDIELPPSEEKHEFVDAFTREDFGAIITSSSASTSEDYADLSSQASYEPTTSTSTPSSVDGASPRHMPALETKQQIVDSSREMSSVSPVAPAAVSPVAPVTQPHTVRRSVVHRVETNVSAWQDEPPPMDCVEEDDFGDFQSSTVHTGVADEPLEPPPPPPPTASTVDLPPPVTSLPSLAPLPLGPFPLSNALASDSVSLGGASSVKSLELPLPGLAGNEEGSATASVQSLDLPSTVQTPADEIEGTAENTAPACPASLMAEAPSLHLSSSDRYSSIVGELVDSGDLQVCQWQRCLTAARDRMDTSCSVFERADAEDVLSEVLKADSTQFHLEALVEIFLVTRRIAAAVEVFSCVKQKLDGDLTLLDDLWNRLSNFLKIATIELPTVSLAHFKTLVSGRTGQKDGSHGSCGVCLSEFDSPDCHSLEFGGREYHSTCANFWVNCVDATLPSFTPPRLL